MPEDRAATSPAVADELPTIAAPRRERRLKPVAPKPRRTPVAAVRVPSGPALPEPERLSAIESKMAGLQSPEDMLRLINTEAALRRAQRLSGGGSEQRQTIRLLSVLMLFALLAAGIGAMWYLETSVEGSHRGARHLTPGATVASPAPAHPASRR